LRESHLLESRLFESHPRESRVLEPHLFATRPFESVSLEIPPLRPQAGLPPGRSNAKVALAVRPELQEIAMFEPAGVVPAIMPMPRPRPALKAAAPRTRTVRSRTRAVTPRRAAAAPQRPAPANPPPESLGPFGALPGLLPPFAPQR